jgi:transcriptional regulator with XRE-family HTH domain
MVKHSEIWIQFIMTSKFFPSVLSDKRHTAPATFDPNYLLDALHDILRVKTDAALSRRLGISQMMISKIRHRYRPIGASLLIRMHEESDLPIAELRALMGDRRQKYRISS